MVYFFQGVQLLGGLALFLFGMDTMGSALERQAGGKLQTVLAKMSGNRWKGLLLGAAATAVIQSSSATTVMVVGFVNSGIMTLRQAVGVVMGSNVGTTATAWLLSLSGLQGESFAVRLFKPATLAPLAGIIGIVLFMSRSERKKGIGTIALGFMTLMTGMELMSDAMAFLRDEPWFARLMVSFTNPVVGILFGAALTALIQSSSASVGILQGLCVTGAVTCGAAIPIILGQNIGTCVTALMGAIGANRNAKRTAMVHLLFNAVGVALFSSVFYGIGLVRPWSFLDEPLESWDISLIHTGFNLAATAVLLPAGSLLVKLACLLVPDAKAPEQPELLDPRLLSTPAVALQRAYGVACDMARSACSAMELALGGIKNYDEAAFDQVTALEKQTDRYQDALGSYLVQLSGRTLSTEENRLLNTLLYAISDMERIADHAVHIAQAGQEAALGRVVFSRQAQEELAVLGQAVTDTLRQTVDAFCTMDLNGAMTVEPREQVVATLVRQIRARHVQRLRDGVCRVEYGFVLEDILTSCGRTADHCSNIAVEMLQVAEGKLEAHGYLSALRSGRLSESAAYAEQFERYRKRYPFPDGAQPE